MWKPSGREWKALLILSVVVPVGLLATFRLTGILEGPAAIAETVTLDVARWEFERPSYVVFINDTVECSYVNDICINHTFIIGDFWDPNKWYGSASLQTGVSLTATLSTGHIENVNITVYDDYLSSFVHVWYLDPDLKPWKPFLETTWDNLTITDCKTDVGGGVEKAFVHSQAVGYPKRVFLRVFPQWVLKTPNNQTQQLDMRVEVTYFNGTVYKKVVQPFQLRLIAENNHSFENAEEISPTQTTKEYLGEAEDFYKVYLTEGEIINVTMRPPASPPTADFDLYLYGSTDWSNPVASSTLGGGGISESIVYNATSTGWWYIKVKAISGCGIYAFTLTRS